MMTVQVKWLADYLTQSLDFVDAQSTLYGNGACYRRPAFTFVVYQSPIQVPVRYHSCTQRSVIDDFSFFTAPALVLLQTMCVIDLRLSVEESRCDRRSLALSPGALQCTRCTVYTFYTVLLMMMIRNSIVVGCYLRHSLGIGSVFARRLYVRLFVDRITRKVMCRLSWNLGNK